MPNENYIDAQNIEDNKYAIPLKELSKFAVVVKAKADDRDELVTKIKSFLGDLKWHIAAGVFHETQTQTRYVMDEFGFVYQKGLSLEDEAKLQECSEATCKLDNGLGFWIRKVEKSTYYLTHNQLTGKSYASPAMKFELERAQSLDSMENFKLKIKPIGYDKRKDIPSGKPNPRSLIR